MTSSPPEPGIRQYFSPWKVAITQLMLFALVQWPFLQGLPTTGRRAYYSEPPFNILIYGVAGFLGLLGVATLPVLWRAIRGRPAIEMSEGQLTFYSVPPRSIELARIEKIVPLDLPPFNLFPVGMSIVRIHVAGQKPLDIALAWLESPSTAWERLKELAPPLH